MGLWIPSHATRYIVHIEFRGSPYMQMWNFFFTEFSHVWYQNERHRLVLFKACFWQLMQKRRARGRRSDNFFHALVFRSYSAKKSKNQAAAMYIMSRSQNTLHSDICLNNNRMAYYYIFKVLWGRLLLWPVFRNYPIQLSEKSMVVQVWYGMWASRYVPYQYRVKYS